MPTGKACTCELVYWHSDKTESSNAMFHAFLVSSLYGFKLALKISYYIDIWHISMIKITMSIISQYESTIAGTEPDNLKTLSTWKTSNNLKSLSSQTWAAFWNTELLCVEGKSSPCSWQEKEFFIGISTNVDSRNAWLNRRLWKKQIWFYRTRCSFTLLQKFEKNMFQ